MRKNDRDSPPWSLVMDNTSESFILLDKDLRIVEFNKVAQKRALALGMTLNKGDFIIDQAAPDRRDGLKALYNEVLAGNPKQYYHEGVTLEKIPVVYYLEYIPLTNNGTVSGILVNGRDVTLEQQALKEISLAEKRFRALIQEGDDLVAIIDHKREIAYTSPNLTRLLGYENDSMLGLSLEDAISTYIHPEDQALLLAEFNRIEFLHKLHLVPFRFKNANGKWECMESTLTNLRKDEAVTGIVANSRIITERVEAEETLKQAYQQITKIFESSLDIICTIDREGRFVQLSNATESLLGYQVEDLKGKYLIDYVHPEDRKETLDVLTPLVRGMQIKDLENRIIRSDKTYVPMMWSASINERDGLTYCVGRDITEKRLTDKRNSESAALLKSVVQTMDESILVVNPQAELIFANKAFFKITGALTGKGYEAWSQSYSLFDKDTRQKIEKENTPVIQALRGNPTFGKEYLVIAPGHSEFPVIVNASALRDSAGRLIGAMVIKRNITEQKTAEAQLKKTEEQISKIFNTVSDVLFMLKVEGPGKFRFVAVNQPFFSATGLQENKVINRLVEEVIPEPSLTLVLEKYAEAVRTHKQLTWEEVTVYPSGKKTGIVTVTPIFDKQGVCIELIGSVNDITSTKEAAEAVYKSNERFEYVTKATSEAIWDWDLTSNEFYRGEGFYTLFGLDHEKTTTDIKFWQAYIHPEDKHRILTSLREALDSDAEGWTGQYRYLKADGEFAIVADRSVIIRSEDGKALRMIGAMQDITDRIYAENLLRHQNEELLKINQELDSFVYSASHELRSPLTAIMGLIILSRSAKKDTEREHYHNLMEKSVQNLDQVIKDIINYSKNARLEVVSELIDFEEMIKESINLFNYMEGGDRVIFNIDINETHPFYSDRNRVSTLLNNIISNAIKYRNPEAEQSKVDIKINQRANSVDLSIADNGLGIPKEKLDDVFKMFVRLTSNMPGSGLGLFIVKEILNKLGGTVHLSSVHGKGTTFHISIPNGKVPSATPGETASITN